VDTTAGVAAVAEAPLDLGLEVGAGAADLVCEPDEPVKVALSGLFAFAELLVAGPRRQPAELERDRPHAFGRGCCVVQDAKQPPSRLAGEERRSLRRDAGLMEHRLDVGEPGVRAAEDRDLLEWAAGGADPLDEVRALCFPGRERPHLRLGTVRTRRAE